MISLEWAPEPYELPFVPAGLNLNILIGALVSSKAWKLLTNVVEDFPVKELKTLSVPLV